MKLQNHFDNCHKRNKAIIAFNIQNLDHLTILSELSSSIELPVMAQFSQKYIDVFDKLIGLPNLCDRYQSAFLSFHLDHCANEPLIQKCIDAGFHSVMFDGSSLPLDDNIKITSRVFEKAHAKGCLLEAELGAIKGVEDGFGQEVGGVYSEEDLLCFKQEARYDLLALAIGNAHGNYTTTEEIDIGLLNRARDLIGSTYFVLHGGTGMPDKMIREAIDVGVVKINVSTALKEKTIMAMKKYVDSEKEFNQVNYYKLLQKELNSFFNSYIDKFTK